jgi:integrating conjugative element protein (TIGR03759 family)
MERVTTFAIVLISLPFLAQTEGATGAPENRVRITQTTDAQGSQSELRTLQGAASDLQRSREWGLQSDEWARYQQLMQGPLGIYSPGLDPLTALGIEARSDAERRHYAELQVRMEGRRVEKLLTYQRAYDDAWKRLYPGLDPVPLPPHSLDEGKSLNEAESSDITSKDKNRLAVFVKDDCQRCDQRVRELQAADRPFDLYLVGSLHDDAQVRRWAIRVGIDAAKVRSRTITLNHDSGRWLSIGGQGELPAVMKEVAGQWMRQ